MSALAALEVGGPPDPWVAVGFAIEAERTRAGDVELRFDPAAPAGLRAWALRGVPAGTDIDGIPCAEPPPPRRGRPPPPHANGVRRVDHVVVMTPALDRTLQALRAVGLEARRTREAGDGLRQAFIVAGPALIEVVGDVAKPGPARLWGVTFVVDDVDALAERFPGALGTPRAAVQPGRRIVTAREQAGLGVPVAFMTPRPGAH